MKYLLDSLILAGQYFKHSYSIADLQDPDQGLIHINKSFQEFTGYSKEEILGQNCRFLQGLDTSKATIKEIRSVIDKRETGYFDIINYKKNGEKFVNRLLLLPVGVGSNNFRYYVGIQIALSELDLLSNKNTLKENPEMSKDLNFYFQDIINFFRGYEYLRIAQDNDTSNDKVEKLAEQIKLKIAKICDFIENIQP